MKHLLFIAFAIFSIISVQAQKNPVSWKFSSQKISAKVYEIKMVATMQTGWHLYSQKQPDDAIAIPTKFTFTPNPLVVADGSVKEVGKLEKFHDATIGVSANQYSRTVTFVQKVTLKAPAKTNLAGSVSYQTCDDKECLPPKKVPFKVDLN
ncbi:MAG TPA: protein-disulfide reductase DsbD family protein [Niabella sp.]|nr:protein-disulfide reductase DsbD family protein [Niabella sp.]HOZ97912.1 protein-disulfide reductase DsbD family protein [Niabella sp.]HQW15942.1 protein-disulfide reductase DsbD family protein [Niabella sp.]HQX21110.1 protein-disulfide reductase DsbD family protein [Niabella sp.]HQX40558.1 protein-disulfide reductase DsbD family protein [Niabella sp.]